MRAREVIAAVLVIALTMSVTASMAASSRPDGGRGPLSATGTGATTSSLPPTLTWAPPRLRRPVVVPIADTGLAAPSLPDQNPEQPWVVTLDPRRDYVLRLDHRREPNMGGLSINGGRNVVIVGGEIEILPMPDSQASRREALVFTDQTGTVHVEGVWVHGVPLRCLVFNSSRAIFQVENVRCDGVTLFQQDFATAHSDAFVTWAAPRILRVDKFTTDYDSSGLALYRSDAGAYPGKVVLRRTNIRNSAVFAGGGTYIYRASAKTRLVIDGLYAETGWRVASWGPQPRLEAPRHALWDGFSGPDPDAGSPPRRKRVGNGRSPGSYILFTRPQLDNVWGPHDRLARIAYGVPPGGDFVRLGVAGRDYRSPGYR